MIDWDECDPTPDEFYDIDVDGDDDEDSDDIPDSCYTCRGTGEGMYDGARCIVCRGRGF